MWYYSLYIVHLKSSNAALAYLHMSETPDMILEALNIFIREIADLYRKREQDKMKSKFNGTVCVTGVI